MGFFRFYLEQQLCKHDDAMGFNVWAIGFDGRSNGFLMVGLQVLMVEPWILTAEQWISFVELLGFDGVAMGSNGGANKVKTT